MSIDYNDYVDQMIVELADRQSGDEIEPKNLEEIHDERFSDSPRSWLHSLASELHSRGLGVDWQDTSNLVFRPNGRLFSKAADLRKLGEIRESSTHLFPAPPAPSNWQFWKREINWTKWGAIGALLAIPTMLLLWWLTN